MFTRLFEQVPRPPECESARGQEQPRCCHGITSSSRRMRRKIQSQHGTLRWLTRGDHPGPTIQGRRASRQLRRGGGGNLTVTRKQSPFCRLTWAAQPASSTISTRARQHPSFACQSCGVGSDFFPRCASWLFQLHSSKDPLVPYQAQTSSIPGSKRACLNRVRVPCAIPRHSVQA